MLVSLSALIALSLVRYEGLDLRFGLRLSLRFGLQIHAGSWEGHTSHLTLCDT